MAMAMAMLRREQNPPIRTPTVLQMEAVECGAACLAMILAHHGRVVPLEELRYACGVSRDGSKASNLVKAARGVGLKAKGLKCEPEDLKQMKLPMILFWNFNHFVVLDGFGPGKVFVNDPAAGRRVVLDQEFDASFTGVALAFEPGPDFIKGGQLEQPAARFAAINLVVLVNVSQSMVEASKKLQMDLGKFTGAALQGIQLMESFKSSGTEGLLFSRWLGHHAKVVNAEQELGRRRVILNALPAGLNALASALILVMGGFRVMDGDMTIGTLVAFQALAAMMNSPVGALVGLGNQIQEAQATFSRLDDVLKHPHSPRAGRTNRQESCRAASTSAT